MATNLKSNPEYARAAQDVEAPAHHDKEAHGTFHWGRGGEGNKMTVGKGDEHYRNKSKERASSKGPTADGAKRRGSFQGVVNKGKEMLGMGKGKQQGVAEKEGGGGGGGDGGSAISEEKS